MQELASKRKDTNQKKVLISIRGLTVEFRIPRGILRAVDNVDLDIYEGEILGLAGESGCGKSVLAHAIINQVDPNGYIKSGKVLFRGEIDVLSLKPEELRKFRWKNVAIVFQGAMNSLNPVMRVGEHFLDTFMAHQEKEGEEKLPPSYSAKKSSSEIFSKAKELLSQVRLDADRVLRLFPHEASGGMKQRAIAALAMLLEPQLLILDEPTSSLDVLTQKYLLRFLLDLHQKTGQTMLFITHDLAAIAEIADRTAIMYLGDIVEAGPTEEIFYNPKHPYTNALLKSIPSITGKVEDVHPLPGPVPDPVNPPPGCPYHPRCPYKIDKCESSKPERVYFEYDKFVACHRFVEV
ncbi:MAG: ABC transporter ATP-binding protein [Candidatus Bathyarchaeia archaeon]